MHLHSGLAFILLFGGPCSLFPLNATDLARYGLCISIFWGWALFKCHVSGEPQSQHNWVLF